ncbi:FAD binding domain-containing protein [Halobacillus campisalis]|uniref:FAD binding domain-containing protein n=1 Tax=Halobacillus campisalis TaxID=435909 RepID=A0ABW2K6X9_9BACI|nr:FAD binding domain-containing protein [Halobacillus campisalis]
MVNEHEPLMSGKPPTLPVPTKVWRPSDLSEAWEVKRQYGTEARYITGGTLIQLQREQGTPLAKHLISLDKINVLEGFDHLEDEGQFKLRIGALTTLSDCHRNVFIEEYWPILAEAIRHVASPAVRNRATIGGNVCYQVGDVIPALMVLEAEAVSFDGTTYLSNDIATYIQLINGEDHPILASISLPEPPVSAQVLSFFKKVGRREAFIPSIVTVACQGCINESGEVEYIRLAAGGGTASPKRLYECERFVQNKVLIEEDLGRLYEMVLQEYVPASDPFTTADYRKTVAANVIVSEFEKLIQ